MSVIHRMLLVFYRNPFSSPIKPFCAPINLNAIIDVIVYTNSRLKAILQNDIGKEIIVSREKVNKFKEWFDGVR